MKTNFEVTSVVTDEATAVEVKGANLDGTPWGAPVSTGWAKKHPRDLPNHEIAYHLAVARALHDLADQYAFKAAEVAGFAVVVDEMEYVSVTDLTEVDEYIDF